MSDFKFTSSLEGPSGLKVHVEVTVPPVDQYKHFMEVGELTTMTVHSAWKLVTDHRDRNDGD